MELEKVDRVNCLCLLKKGGKRYLSLVFSEDELKELPPLGRDEERIVLIMDLGRETKSN